MNVNLRELLELPETRLLTSTVEAEEFRQLFSERMAELNQRFQFLAGHANRADYHPLEAQKMKLYEAFQKTSAMFDAGDPTKGEQSIKRIMSALDSIENRAAEAAAGATARRDEWSKREEDFDNLMVRIGELEEAGNTKAGTLRKLADGIRNKANERSYDQSVSAYDQLRPKFEQIYQQQQANCDVGSLAPGGAPTRGPREPLQMEQLGKSESVNSDRFSDYPNYQDTETEVRGTSEQPLATDYYPEGLPYTKGQSGSHQDATRTPRADRKQTQPSVAKGNGTSGGYPILKEGSQGPDVVKLQRLLGLAADGHFGPKTADTVRRFQASKGLKGDGVVGPQTWAALGGGSPKPTPPVPPTPKKNGAYPSKPVHREREPLQMEELGTPGVEKIRMQGVSESSTGEAGDFRYLEGSYQDKDGNVAAEGVLFEGQKGDTSVTLGKFQYSDTDEGVQASAVLGQSKEQGVTNTVVQVEHKDGVFQEGDDTWAGQKTSGVVAKKEIDPLAMMDPEMRKSLGLDKFVLQGDAAVLSASKDEWFSTKDGIGLGAQANLIEGSITFGTQNTDRDETKRVGLSAGEGAAARVHWADKDGDGVPEFGIGGDVAFMSFDIKTEDPLRKALEANGGIFGQVAKLVDGNLTNKTIEGATGQSAKEFYDDRRQDLQSATQAITDVGNRIEQTAGEVFDGVLDFAKKGLEAEGQRRSEEAHRQAEAAKKLADDATNWASEQAGELKKEAEGVVQKITDFVGEATQSASDQRDREIQRDAELGQQVVEQAQQAYQEASNTVSEVAQGVEDFADRLFGD